MKKPPSNNRRNKYYGENIKDYFFSRPLFYISTSTKVKLAQEPEKTAIKMVLTDMVEDYNSKSRMNRTKAMWKAQDLPYQIDINELLGE